MIIIVSIIVLLLSIFLIHKYLLRNKYQDLSKYSKDKKIIIIGSGFSGIDVAISLKRMKFTNFVIYEMQNRVGGAWAKNTYPGCACDVLSHLYSYSYDLNPFWSRKYPDQAQLQQYMERVAKKYGVMDHIKFQSEVLECRYDQKNYQWGVKVKSTKNGKTTEFLDQADLLVPCQGGMNWPSIPEFAQEGKNIFKGKIMHTAEYDNSYTLKGKKIALIGNSASAVQVAPHLQKAAKKFYQFQRTPIHMVQKRDSEYSKTFIQLCDKVPGLIRLYRIFLYFTYEPLIAFFKFKALTKIVEKFIIKQMVKTTQVLKEEDRKHMFPTYTFGVVKPVLSNDYYSTIAQPNAELVPHGVKKLTEKGIIASNGQEYEVDCIILATGFKVNQMPFPVFGVNGQNLSEQWDGVPKAFKGTSNPNFPNMLQMSGANSVFTHNSQLISIECQAYYVSQMISYIFENDVKQIDVKEEKFNEYQKYLDKLISPMALSANPLKKVLIFGGTTFQFWNNTKKFNPDNYNIQK